MQKYFIKSLLVSIIFLFGACGDTGKSHITTQTTDSKIEAETKVTLQDSEKTRFYMEVLMKSNYTEGVIAELSNISLDLNACNISQSNLNVIDNRIEFTHPQDTYLLKYTAEFTSPCSPNGYIITADNKLMYEDTSNTIRYDSGFIPIDIDANTTTTTPSSDNSTPTTTSNNDTNDSDVNSSTSVTTASSIEDINAIYNYDLNLISLDNKVKINLTTKKRYKLSLIKTDSNSTVDSNNINSITIKSKDTSKARLIDPNSADEIKDELSFTNTNNIDLYIQTYTTSGIVSFDLTANYIDNLGNMHDINKTVPITIQSGEPTAFSINSAGVEYKTDTKWFEQKFLISASDKYNNIVNLKSQISVSAMADFAKDGNNNRLLHGNFSNIKGQLIADSDAHSATFESNMSDFSQIDTDRDFLLLFGDITAYEALGKWSIDRYNNTETSLELIDSYYGENHENLGFAIGHNYYKEICSSESKEWELKVDSSDGTYRLDEEGKTYVTLKFPAYMIGKRVAISVNFSGAEKRSGEVHFETLHSFQGVKSPEAISLESESPPISEIVYFEVDTGTEDRFWVKNAQVVCNTTTQNVIISNFRQNSEIKNISDCGGSEGGEIAYWQFTVQLLDSTKSGSFSFNECQVSSFLNEF